MKATNVVRVACALLLVVSSAACGSLVQGTVRVGRGQSIDYGTVVDYIRLNDEAGARSWLEKQAVAPAEIDRLLVKAKVKVARERLECSGKDTCALGGS